MSEATDKFLDSWGADAEQARKDALLKVRVLKVDLAGAETDGLHGPRLEQAKAWLSELEDYLIGMGQKEGEE